MSDVWPVAPPAVGDSAEMSTDVTVEDMQRFFDIAGAVAQRSWLLDEDLAAAGVFGRLVIQSGVITAILGTVASEKLPGPGCVFVNTNLDYKQPVHPGQTITGRLEVVDVQQETPVCTLRATVTRDDGVVAVEGTVTTFMLPGADELRAAIGAD